MLVLVLSCARFEFETMTTGNEMGFDEMKPTNLREVSFFLPERVSEPLSVITTYA